MYTIYALIDPHDVYTRFSQHVRGEGHNIGKNVWIQELKDDDVMLIMKTIEVVKTLEDARIAEQKWIQFHLPRVHHM